MYRSPDSVSTLGKGPCRSLLEQRSASPMCWIKSRVCGIWGCLLLVLGN